jgi:hypothetical protein
VSTSVDDYLQVITTVDGWLSRFDVPLLRLIDEQQNAAGVTGDILEIGVFEGKSAILFGYFVRAGEELLVCDPFGEVEFNDPLARTEADRFYADLTLERFKHNYLRFHPSLPRIHRGVSSELRALDLDRTSYRMVHVDGSHLFDCVRSDIDLARDLLGPGGVVVIDDITSAHTPGVHAAAWEAVRTQGLIPLCITSKLYATWSADPVVSAAELRATVAAQANVEIHDDVIHGHPVFTAVPIEAPGMSIRPSIWRRTGIAMTPPAVWEALHRVRGVLARDAASRSR